jgi:hypothetical protein
MQRLAHHAVSTCRVRVWRPISGPLPWALREREHEHHGMAPSGTRLHGHLSLADNSIVPSQCLPPCQPLRGFVTLRAGLSEGAGHGERKASADMCGRDWSAADDPENETTSHAIGAAPKIPRGGTDLVLSVHGVEQGEARSTQPSSRLRPRKPPGATAA